MAHAPTSSSFRVRKQEMVFHFPKGEWKKVATRTKMAHYSSVETELRPKHRDLVAERMCSTLL